MKTGKNSITVRAGRLEFHKINAATWDWRDFYHWLLTLSWSRFAAFILGVYMTINLAFASLYALSPGCIAEMPPYSFSDAFFFSVETLATVGYGHMYPDSLYGHIISTMEIMVGMFGMAVITGLIFVRFSRPTARLEYSRGLVLTVFDGHPTLIWRVANLRHQAMVEAEFRTVLIRNETTREGETMRRFHPLKLQFERLILFPAVVTIRHVIDQASPLHGITPEKLKLDHSIFVVSVICIDTVIPAPVHSQKDYNWRDVEFGKRFVEIYSDEKEGSIAVDYGRLHDTETAPEVVPGE